LENEWKPVGHNDELSGRVCRHGCGYRNRIKRWKIQKMTILTAVLQIHITWRPPEWSVVVVVVVVVIAVV